MLNSDTETQSQAPADAHENLTKRDDKQDAARWRLIEYLLLGDEPADDADGFRTMIAEIAYSHQIDIGINRPAPSTLELIDELVAGYARGEAGDAAESL